MISKKEGGHLLQLQARVGSLEDVGPRGNRTTMWEHWIWTRVFCCLTYYSSYLFQLLSQASPRIHSKASCSRFFCPMHYDDERCKSLVSSPVFWRSGKAEPYSWNAEVILVNIHGLKHIEHVIAACLSVTLSYPSLLTSPSEIHSTSTSRITHTPSI
jgi:hypothetical protein